MPIIDFDNVNDMIAELINLANTYECQFIKPAVYARQFGISRQGVHKRCKNSKTVFYLRVKSQRSSMVVDTGNPK